MNQLLSSCSQLRFANWKSARAKHVSATALAQRYFADRTDGLRPPANTEELLMATIQVR